VCKCTLGRLGDRGRELPTDMHVSEFACQRGHLGREGKNEPEKPMGLKGGRGEVRPKRKQLDTGSGGEGGESYTSKT